MFEHIVLNLMHDGVNISDIFLCTTRSPADDKLQKIAFQLGIKVIRGEEAEPIKRYWDNLYIWKDYDYISRVNGDSPMYIARLGLEALERIDNLNSLPDVITSIRGGKRNFPSGLSLEMYKAQHLNALLSEHQEYCCREHMSELIGLSENRGGQILDVMPHSSILDEYNCKLTIDTYDDYCFINDLVETERFQDFLDYFRAIQLSFERFN